MANQIYSYSGSSYGVSGAGSGGGLSSVYPSSSYLSDPSSRYLSSTDPLSGGSSARYLTSSDPLGSSAVGTDTSKYYSSSLYQAYQGSDYGAAAAGGIGSYSAASRIPPSIGGGMGGMGVSQASWGGLDVGGTTGYDPNAAGLKRPNEALYHQTVLGTHNSIGQSEGLFSTNTLAKRPRFESATSLPVYPQRPGEKDCAHYMLTRNCRFGEGCKFDHPVWVPEGGIPDWKEVPLAVVPEVLPERPGEPDCPYFLKTQKCKFGFRCKFNHPKDTIDSSNPLEAVDVAVLPERPSEPTCSFYLKTGKCKYGAVCKFHHPKDIQIPQPGLENGNEEQTEFAVKDDGTAGDGQLVKPFVPFTPALLHNSKGLPIRPGEADCPFYLKTGSCKYGANCRYNHPDRHAINPPVAAGFGHAVFPSSAGNINMGIINPAASILPTVDPRLASQTSLGLTPAIYPQRPGQMECDFYMKTGVCKFGERCKFHHPFDRSATTPTMAKQAAQQNVKLTLAGLPRREGSIICPFYMKTGTCKYGVTCRFDHPPPGEAIAMATVQGTSSSAGGEGEEQGTEADEV